LQLNFRNERTQSTLFDPKLMFGVFSEFPLRVRKLAPKGRSGHSSVNWSEIKVAVEFFEMKAPNRLHLNQNSYLVRFLSFHFWCENSCETRPLGPFWPV